MGPLLELAQVPLDAVPFFGCAKCTTQLGGIAALLREHLISSYMKTLNNNSITTQIPEGQQLSMIHIYA